MGSGSQILIEIYTDGGCSGNPGPGGWAYVIIRTDDPRNEDGENCVQSASGPVILAENWGADESTTNNRMELFAVISALKALSLEEPEAEKVTVFTDSQYVQKGISEWILAWKRNSWRTSGKKPVKNQDLWLELDALAASLPITWKWVKGHAGNEYNERCDALTQKAIARNW